MGTLISIASLLFLVAIIWFLSKKLSSPRSKARVLLLAYQACKENGAPENECLFQMFDTRPPWNSLPKTFLRESQTRPGPVSRVLDQPCANRIAEHVAEDREEVVVLLNRRTFEAALPDMTMTPVMPMIAAHMARHPPLHKRTECVRGRGLQHEMKWFGMRQKSKTRTGYFDLVICSSARNAA
jgi:hypothetical protein